MRFKFPVDVDIQVVAHLGLTVRGVVRRVNVALLGTDGPSVRRNVLTTRVYPFHV